MILQIPLIMSHAMIWHCCDGRATLARTKEGVTGLQYQVGISDHIAAYELRQMFVVLKMFP